MLKRALLVTIALVLPFAAVAACNGDGGDDGDVTTTPDVTATVDTTPDIPTPSGEIRERDLENTPAVQDLLADTGGEYLQENVIYDDVTGDGIDDAVVPISSGGTLGNVAFVVLTPVEGGTYELLSEAPEQSGGIALEVVDGVLTMIEPVYGTDDPECCPSLLKRTTYAWDGNALLPGGVETVANPDGAVKPTTNP
jgi:hypothetical protein